VKRVLIIALLVSFVIGTLSLSAIAADQDKDKIQRSSSDALLGWTEIPKTIAKVTKDTDNPLFGITIGLVKGVLNAFARTVSGIADVATLHKPDLEKTVDPKMIKSSQTK